MASSASRLPLICIFGATATGKTKLSVQLARFLGGEIISADSMQAYRGLDIATNKATEEERQGVPHHFLDVLEPSQQLTMPEFRSESISLINEMHARGKIPILVGGTHYYVEALMFRTASDLASSCRAEQQRDDIVLDAEGPELYQQLLKYDPASADRHHPNNVRKVRRSLEILKTTGVTHTEWLEREREAGMQLRYTPTVCFWLDPDWEVLEKRMVSRIDTMISQGLVSELLGFYSYALSHLSHKQEDDTPADEQQEETVAQEGPEGHVAQQQPQSADEQELDFTRGVLQAIGFKEFAPLLHFLRAQGWQPPHTDSVSGLSAASLAQAHELVQTPQGAKLLAESKEKLYRATRKYAKQQLRRIKGRMLKGLHLFKLDTSDPSMWEETVWAPCKEMLASVQSAEPPTV